jgi:galactoside O-acetyltransferase
MFYNYEELLKIGFKELGENVLISTKCSIYGASRISIGNNVRIDDFVVISTSNGEIKIGNNIHIAIYSSLQGEGKIEMMDFSGISSRVAVYSSNADYSGNFLTNPNIPEEYTNTITKDVIFHKHSLVGSGSIIMPGVILHTGAVVGALSFVKNDCEEFSINVGNPAKKIKERSRKLLVLENKMIND